MPYGRNITYLSPVGAVKMKESKEDYYGDKEEDSGTEETKTGRRNLGNNNKFCLELMLNLSKRYFIYFLYYRWQV